jgi:hypothetical protein
MDRVQDCCLCNIAHQRGHFFDPTDGQHRCPITGGGPKPLFKSTLT